MAFRERVTVEGRSALVLGGTGATGKHVVEELVKRDQWARVVVIGRRPIENADSKVENYVLDLDKDDVDVSKLEGISHFFNCIGTTRALAGGADRFHAIEVGISEKVAQACNKAGIKSGSVISAQGANETPMCAPKWFHPLFYGKTMGLKEKAMKDNFVRTTVFRPGMLARGSTDRFMERMFGGILPSLPVETLAKAMVNDAEAASLEAGVTQEAPLYVVGNGKITKLSQL